MTKNARYIVVAATVLLGAASAVALAQETKLEPGFGPNPQLPEPSSSLIPTVNVPTAIGWQAGQKPTPVTGLAVSSYAANLDHPRWLYVLPNSDVLVAETNAPERPDANKGIKGMVMRLFMKKAGAGVESPNRITLLRGLKADGTAAEKFVFLEGLNSPFGMTLAGDTLYIANTDVLVKFPYTAGDTRISAAAVKVADLPGGTLNHHWTKNVIASPDGTKLYVTVGSNSNVAENGIDKEEYRAAILEIDTASGASRVFASGLRNPNGMAFEPSSKVLWTVVNERDELGNDLVPDYLTSVKDGGFYGWPYSYFGQNVDKRVQPERTDLVAKAIAPDYALGAHTASLGLTFAGKTPLAAPFANGAFIGQHGSWNRKPASGYKVIFVPFADGKPTGGAPVDVLTGFLDADGNALGRPVGVALASDGALLVADDVGNQIWRVSAARQTSEAQGGK